MTDLRQQLHDLVDRAPVGPVPIDAMLETRHWTRRIAPAAAVAVAALLIAAIVFAVPHARRSDLPTTAPSDPVVTLSPLEAVRGAEVEVTVAGLAEFAGAEVELAVATTDAASEQGVGSGRIDEDGHLSMTITMPNVLGEETPVEPGAYRLMFVVHDSHRLRFDRPVRVIAAMVNDTYGYVPTYDCLNYTWFDGRLWKLAGSDVTAPTQGSTIALVSRDRATYVAPDGRTATYRAADPATFDPVTFSCPAKGTEASSTLGPPIRTTSTMGAPTELPAIASLKGSWTMTGGGVHHEYRLAGPANADTATPEALAANPRSLAIHPATYLTVDFIPHVDKHPEVPGDPAYSNTETVDVNGVTGTLTTMKSGLGVVRLDWVDAAGNYHVVMVDRLKTSDGRSGLSAKQILDVGRSIQ